MPTRAERCGLARHEKDLLRHFPICPTCSAPLLPPPPLPPPLPLPPLPPPPPPPLPPFAMPPSAALAVVLASSSSSSLSSSSGRDRHRSRCRLLLLWKSSSPPLPSSSSASIGSPSSPVGMPSQPTAAAVDVPAAPAAAYCWSGCHPRCRRHRLLRCSCRRRRCATAAVCWPASSWSSSSRPLSSSKSPWSWSSFPVTVPGATAAVTAPTIHAATAGRCIRRRR
ncbi:hypothetical protein BV25DRAFT_1922297 [Artomyces pyxidatus]|uniref:Uncharacterized protein n=1 Tax=Artomyces pyxidatus TaxID=48021 RepID=A0ACB8SE87_9AGAM|nr:hypothetical protein BV25DRAFT_1922297 [Artomyces pyxidatus]